MSGASLRVDHTGKTFGMWTVLRSDVGTVRSRWICRCECGTERSVMTQNLTKPNGSQSCGCVLKVDRAGEVYGNLTVVERDPRPKRWKCLCTCGRIVGVGGSDLVLGKQRSCGAAGCRPKLAEDLSGRVYGRWTVERRDLESRPHDPTPYWWCVCSCGTRKSVAGWTLKNGRSLGCLPCRSLGTNLVGQSFGKLKVTAKTTKLVSSSPVWRCLCSCGKTVTAPSYELTRGTTRSCGCVGRRPKLMRAYFYHILTDGGFSGFGITWSLRNRILQHKKALERAGVAVTRTRVIAFRGRKAALAFEKQVKYTLSSDIVNTYVPGFRTEAVLTKHNRRLFALVRAAGKQLTDFQL